MRKSDYLKVLREHKLSTQPSDGEAVTTEVDAVPVVVDATAEPTLAPERSEPAPAAPPVASTPAPTPAAMPAPEPELFPGENLLAPEARAQIRAQFEAAKRATTLEDDLKKLRHEYNLVHGRVAPTQQLLSKAQVETQALRAEVSKLKAAQTTGTTGDIRKRIEAMKAQFPEDAQMWEGMLATVEQADQRAAQVDERLQKLQQREEINEQLTELTQAHPDWRKRKSAITQDAQANYVVQPLVDTPEAREFSVWANGLGPYERQVLWPLLGSSRAADAIYLLDRFEHDKAVALEYVKSQAPASQQQQVTTATPPASAASVPVPDPDPSRRTTAPSTAARAAASAARQPVSEKHAEFLQATKAWEALRQERAKRSNVVRRA